MKGKETKGQTNCEKNRQKDKSTREKVRPIRTVRTEKIDVKLCT
jgi:hypothetical protein